MYKILPVVAYRNLSCKLSDGAPFASINAVIASPFKKCSSKWLGAASDATSSVFSNGAPISDEQFKEPGVVHFAVQARDVSAQHLIII